MTPLVLDLIDRAAARGPDRTAIVCGNERLSHRELLARSHALASYLVARGVGPEHLVCIAVEPSPWAPIAMLGVLRAGAAYVPLDPAYPAARLADMLAQVGRGAPIVLTTSSSASRLPPDPAATLELDRAWPEIGDTPAAALPAAAPEQLAYVIFTSGSTGRPKGVMVPHAGLANLVTAQIETFAIDAASVILQFAPLSFDASVSEVFTALAAGATLCLAPRDELAPGPRLVELMRRHRVTVATLPPSSLALLDPAAFPTLRTIVSAGEACSADLVARWAPGRRFLNAYGPTEVTVCATMAVCDVDVSGRAPSLGEPLRGANVHLLDADLRSVGHGRPGEIFVGGAGVARGYLGRPDLTAERFLPDPWAHAPGARMYRTGDLARRRDDGSLEFLGRTDDQVKVRGHRIELGEVEAVLRTAPGVRDALVIAREDRPGDVRLIGYVIGDPGLDRSALRTTLEAQLPAFARPTDLVVLDDWPRSPAGKIDRARLPTPIRAGSAGAARSDLEFRLTEIWQDVLGVGAIGPDDDFFDLGGHSLLAIRMLSRVRDELDADLPLSLMAERRTVARLAEAVASHGAHAALGSPVALRAAGTGQPLFLVPPVSGSALAYLPLLRRMSADRPIHAFHAPGLDGRSAPPARFEDLAAHFVRELLAARPRGPYLLGGWSIGGAAAIEMALQLAELGHDVPALVLVDSNAPTPYLAQGVRAKFGELNAATLAFMYVNNFARCFEIDLGLDKARFAGLSPGDLAQAALGELRRVPSFAPDIDHARLDAHIAVFGATATGFMRWQPARRYRGRIINFLARDGHPEFGHERYDWSSFVERPVETIEVPGNHFSLVNEPHVAALGAALDRVLEGIP
ncbi:MAG: amino acid adenylation domain-containing protein [Deltaproteobacteria bacterium]|nr:MAG: amino acid adenylation domain-containing protein [Deltaproteobacteria bacterium]